MNDRNKENIDVHQIKRNHSIDAEQLNQGLYNDATQELIKKFNNTEDIYASQLSEVDIDQTKTAEAALERLSHDLLSKHSKRQMENLFYYTNT